MRLVSHRSLLRWLALATGGCTTLAAVAATPSSLRGQWEVIQVAVDHRDQPHWLYFPDDPRLLGRQLSIGTDVWLDDDSRACSSPAFTSLPTTTLQHFIGTRYPRPVSFGVPTRPSLTDFGIKLPDVTVSPLQTHCSPDTSPWNGTWFVAVSANRLLTNYDNNGYVLLLRRQDNHTPIHASFACAKAHGASEQAICASASLAAYDRSVAAAYQRALRQARDDAGAIRQAQRTWLGSRNTCGGDADCLAKSMRERVDQLMQQ